MTTERLERIECAVLEGVRPHSLGRNARLVGHGAQISVPVCRITTSGGVSGVGFGRPSVDVSYEALGLPVDRVFTVEEGTRPEWWAFDYPLWDWVGKREGLPVRVVVATRFAGGGVMTAPESVALYDTSFYFDDLDGEGNGVDRIVERARSSYARGHRAFKVKVGRGARWMEPEDGLRRDIAVVEAVREAIGGKSTLLVDANDGFTFNGVREFVRRSVKARLCWLEEPFHEDRVLFEALGEWLAAEGIGIDLADGESARPTDAIELAAAGCVDVVQCDIMRTGFTGWLSLGLELDRLGVGSSPHHFGAFFGNFVTAHLGGAVRGLRYVEWDEATVMGLDGSGYRISDGRLLLPELPGFGLGLDEERFAWTVRKNGFDLMVRCGRSG